MLIKRLTPGLFWTALVVGTTVSAELLVRWLLEPPGLYPRSQETPILATHPVRGYALRTGASGQYRAGGRAGAIRINASGFRDEPVSNALASELRVLALGDSFTMGLGVEEADAWPEQLEARLQRVGAGTVSVVNAGVPGYNVRQMRATAEELIPWLRPHIIVVGINGETYWRMADPYVYYGGQLVRTSVAPSLRSGPRGLYYSPIAHPQWLHGLDLWLNRHVELGAHLVHLAFRAYGRWVARPATTGETSRDRRVSFENTQTAFRPALEEIGHLAALSAAHHATLIALLINPQESGAAFGPEQYVYNELVEGFCRSQGIRVVNPLPALAATAAGQPIFRSPDDYHWSPEAHRLAADTLYAYLTREGLLTP